MSVQAESVNVTRDYYDSKSADEFYHTVWGGEDIHIGIYERPGIPILEASNKTVKETAARLDINSDSKIIDIGSGYGGAARYLAKNFGCHVTCLNLSEVENQRNEEKNQAQGLDELISVAPGNFEDIPADDAQFDVVWSEDAILHSDRKDKVFAEVHRILKPGGTFIFTDPMQSDNCPEGVLQPILDRIHLKELGSVKKYRAMAADLGFQEVNITEMPEQLINHYSSVLKKLEETEPVLREKGVEQEYIDNMKKGLNHWIEGGKNDYLNWGIMQFKKG